MAKQKYFNPKTLIVTVKELLLYDTVKGSGGEIWRDKGSHIQLLIPAETTPKGHDTIEVYLDDQGRIIKIFGHPTNSGFRGVKYF